MKIKEQLSPNEAAKLTESIEDIKQIQDSNLSEWFKGTYNMCLMVLKPKLYNEMFPDFDIEKHLNEFKKKFTPHKQTIKSSAFCR